MGTMFALFFPAMCIYGTYDILKGIYYGDFSTITIGIIIALIGINMSILSPINLAVLVLSGIATFFVDDWYYSIGVGIALIAIYTAYCLFVYSPRR